MRALRWDGARLAVADVPEPLLEDGHAPVRVGLAGVCATDLQITRGCLGFRGTLGNEFTGVVEAAADPQLDALVTGCVSVAPLVDAVYPLADGGAALERASRPETA